MSKGKKIVLGIVVAFIVIFVGSAVIAGVKQGLTTGQTTSAESNDTENQSKEVKELSNGEKEKLKNEVSEKVKDKNVTDISILTDNQTGKPIISMQLKGNIDKTDVNKEEAEKLVYELEDRVKDISDKVQIQLIDKNSQVILMYMDKQIEYYK